MRVRLVCYEDVNEWILGKFALKLQEQLQLRGVEVDIAKIPDSSADVSHHITYWGYERRISQVETLMITHIDTLEKEQRLRQQLMSADMGVCMSTDTVRKLNGKGFPSTKLCYINPAHDGLILPRKTVIGITSRLYEDLRKREEMLVELIGGLDPQKFTFSIMGAGWQQIVDQLRQHGMEIHYQDTFDYKAYQELIRGLDYYLYLGQDEGSMGFLDAAAAGVATIVTPQGFHLDASKAITHTFEKLEDLKNVFEEISLEKGRRIDSVTGWTWESYADRHLRLWESLLTSRALPSDLQLAEKRDALMQPEVVVPERVQQNLKVLMVLHGNEGATKGGPSIRTQITASHLKRLGVSVTITCERYPDPTGFDLVHLFNVWHPESALAVLNHLKTYNIPVVFSPIYLELSEFAWAHKAIRIIFEMARDKSELDNYLNSMERGELAVDGECSADRIRDIVPGYTVMLRTMFSLADFIIFLSDFEKKQLENRGIFANFSHLVHNGVDAGMFRHSSETSFSETYKVHDYVLCVGRVELRKNQLLLLEALRNTDITVVIIGHSLEPDYAELVKSSNRNLVWVEHLPHGDLLVSAYQEARVFVLPSWSEGAPLSALEAAAAGVPLVLSDRSSEHEYFGDLASYCNPASISSIRSAVLHEYNGYDGQKERCHRLQQLTAEKYSWERTAGETLEAYKASLAGFGSPSVSVSASKYIPCNYPDVVFDVSECENDIDLKWINVITWAPVWMTRSERLMLFSLIYSLRPERYLEIGVYKGGSTLITCAALDSLGASGKMFCVDIERQVDPKYWDKVKHRADLILGASPGILPDVALKAGGTFDFALVDGDHRYESVIRDAEGVAPYISPGGYVLFHDSYNEGVGQAIEDFVQRHSEDFHDLGFITRETTRGTSPDGLPAHWGGLRLVQKKQTIINKSSPKVIDGCNSSSSLAASICEVSSMKSKSEKISVIYDISVLGLGELYESARTGIYRVVEHVVQGLSASPEIQLAFCATQAITENSPETVTGCRRYLAGHQEYQHIPFFESGFPAVDIFHSPFHAIPNEIEVPVRFLTVYDLIPIMFPQFIPPHVTRLQQTTFAQTKPGDQFICISHATKKDLCQIVGIAPERATVTHLAADPVIFYPCTDELTLATIRTKYGIGNVSYILSLCTLEPRKNIDHVIRAFARLVRNGQVGETKLVLTGTKGWDFNRIFSEIDSNPELHSRIVLTGYVPDEDLAPLYSGATVFVYMSLYEGFGLPPLEAMQCGVPVITSDTSSLPEVVGDVGIMLDPHDLEGLCQALQEVLSNRELHRERSKRSLLQAANFSWNRCVEETIAAYKKARNNQKAKDSPKRDSAIVIDGVIFQLQHGRPFGISRLWWSLLTELAATPLAGRIVLLDREGTAPEIPGIRRRRVTPFQLGTAQEQSPGLDRVCCEENAGLFISTYYTFTTSTPSLLMLYDMIPERFDSVGPDAPNPEWRDKYHTIANSTSFAAISQSTAHDLATFYPLAAQRPLTVIPCAVSDDFRVHTEGEITAFKTINGIDRPYFLLVGRRDPHKNAALFFRAFSQLPDRKCYAIIMAGGGNALEPELRELAGPAVGYAGFFSDQDLSLAYSGAIALVYPSLYEGFGLPILEAMQSGCPVITCHNSSLSEVAGSAALYVGEQDAEAMSRALLDVQNPDVRAYLIKRGLERTRLFSWQKSAALLADCIQKYSGAAATMQIRGEK